MPAEGDVGGEDNGSSDDDTESDGDDQKPSKRKSKDGSSISGVYVPPKLSAVHYDGEDTKAERNRKQLERAKKRALRYIIFHRITNMAMYLFFYIFLF